MSSLYWLGLQGQLADLIVQDHLRISLHGNHNLVNLCKTRPSKPKNLQLLFTLNATKGAEILNLNPSLFTS